MVMLNNKQIHELRMVKGMSASEFGKLLGVKEDAIWKWEKGTRKPLYDSLAKLSDLWQEAVVKGLFRDAVSA